MLCTDLGAVVCRSDLAVGRGGIQPTPMRTYRRRASREGLVGLGRRAEPWACSASSRGATGGRIVLFGRSPPPLRHTSSTLSRAAAPVCGALVPSERQWVTQRPRRDVERAPQAAGAPPVARLPQQARASGPWVVQQLEAHVQPGQLVRALGGGPLPHAMTQHHSSAPPRHARPTRRVRADRMW